MVWFVANSKLRRAAVFFMGAVLTGLSAVWLMQGGGVRLAPGQETVLAVLFTLLNVVVTAAYIGLGWLWRSTLLAVFAAAQAILLGWIGLGGKLAMLGAGLVAADHLSLVFLLVFNFTGPLAILGIAGSAGQSGRNLAAACLVLAAMNGLVLAGNLFWLFFFWQLGSLCALVAVLPGKIAAAGRVVGQTAVGFAAGGACLLGAAALCLKGAGTLRIDELLLFRDVSALMPALALLVVAGLAGAAQYPFQGGLIRSASQAGSAMCAFLQGATLLNAGVFLLIRFSPLLMNTWLAKLAAVLGAFSFAAGALAALLQHEVKRSLAYSTVSVLGLAIALACLPDLQSIYAAVWVVVFHALAKTQLYFCANEQFRQPLADVWFVAAIVTMVMPPFGIPAGIWTAVEGAVRQPVLLVCLAVGSLFHGLYLLQLAGTRKSGRSVCLRIWREAWVGCRKHWILGMALLAAGLLQIPLTGRFLSPILKENFKRFADVAAADPQSLLVSSVSGVNPAWLLLVAGGGVAATCWLLQRLSGTTAEAPVVAALVDPEALTAVESVDEVKPAESLLESLPPDLRGAVSQFLPIRRRVELYCSLTAAGLIILMFEVVVR